MTAPNPYDAQSTSPIVHTERASKFVSKWSAPTLSKATRCSYFVLVHTTEHGTEPVTQEQVEPMPGAKRTARPEAQPPNPARLGEEQDHVDAEASRIASALVGEALAVTGNFPRPQLFAIGACTGLSTPPIAQLTFRLVASEEAKLGFSDSGSGKLSGEEAIAAMVDFAKSQAKLMAENMQRMQDRMVQLLELTTDRNRTLEANSVMLVTAMQESLDRKATRELEAYRGTLAANREERTHLMLENVVGKVLPKVLDRFGAGPMSTAIRMLRPEQVMSFVATLEPDQRAALIEALDGHLGLNLLGAGTPTNAKGGDS